VNRLATIVEQIADIQAEIDKTQKNKATEHHVGKLKAKIAALKAKQERVAAHAKSGGPAKGFEVKKSGDASVALVGFPSVGKSTLIGQVTDADSHTDTQFNYYFFQTFTQGRGFNRIISLNLSWRSVPSPNKFMSHDIAGIKIAESENKINTNNSN